MPMCERKNKKEEVTDFGESWGRDAQGKVLAMWHEGRKVQESSGNIFRAM